MALDSSCLAIAALVFGATGASMIRASRRDAPRLAPALAECGLGFAASAIGLATILVASDAATSPVRTLGEAATMFGAGLVWSGARRFGSRGAPRPAAVAAGAMGWLCVVLVASPPLGWRIGIGSLILAAYAFAAAHAFTRNRRSDAQRRSGFVLAAHGGFHALRAVLGPSLGLAAWGPSLSRGSGVVFGAEAVLFAVLFGGLAIAMSRDDAVEVPREETLEDALTGVGNPRALFGSGATLLAEASAAGKPLGLLVMDLDRFELLNGRHGRAAGDRLLVAFARLVHDYLPPTSLVCRLAGDTFVALLPGAEPERALVVADELRSLFAHLSLESAEGPVAATVSIGIAQARPGRPALNELLDAARHCLAAAKAAGRDYVVHEAELPPGAGRRAA